MTNMQTCNKSTNRQVQVRESTWNKPVSCLNLTALALNVFLKLLQKSAINHIIDHADLHFGVVVKKLTRYAVRDR